MIKIVEIFYMDSIAIQIATNILQGWSATFFLKRQDTRNDFSKSIILLNYYSRQEKSLCIFY